MGREWRLTCVNLRDIVTRMTAPPRDPRIPDLVSLQEAADIIGISKQAVLKRIMARQLPAARVGTAWVLRRAVAEAARKSVEP